MRIVPSNVSDNCSTWRAPQMGVEKLSYYSSATGGPIVLRLIGRYAFRNPFGTVYPLVTGGVSLRVRTCTPHRCLSETARPIAFKFAVWLVAH